MNCYANFWREARTNSGLSQSELSLKLGNVSPQFVSNVERGRVRYSIPTTGRLIPILKVDLKDVLRIILEQEKIRLRKGLR